MNTEDYFKLSQTAKIKEDWMNTKWRPMMGWLYLLVCIFDFVFFPILWSLIQALGHGQVNMQWQPITLQGAGLFHISMGAILGIAVYGRTQEKLNGVSMIQLPSNVGTTYIPPSSSKIEPNFGESLYTKTFIKPIKRKFTESVITGYGGKACPPQPIFPEL
jgi:hypothetical protein